jgi:hypothetical protein
MEKILFEDAALTSQAKVTIDGVDHLVTEAEYSGGTDLNANTFNQLQDNVEDAINEVVESGSNENGSWIKWSDGTMICTRVIPVNSVTINTAWGTMYVYEDNNTYNFAQEFIDVPDDFQQTFLATSPAGCWLGSYGNAGLTKSGFNQFALMRPTIQTVTGKLFVKAIGKWK